MDIIKFKQTINDRNGCFYYPNLTREYGPMYKPDNSINLNDICEFDSWEKIENYIKFKNGAYEIRHAIIEIATKANTNFVKNNIDYKIFKERIEHDKED